MRSSTCDTPVPSMNISAIMLFVGCMMILVSKTNSFIAPHFRAKPLHPLMSINTYDLRQRPLNSAIAHSQVQKSVLFLSSKPSMGLTDFANFTKFDSQISSFIEMHSDEIPSVTSSESSSLDDSGALSPSKPSSEPPQRQSLEPIIYHLNKALIDMVYNIICKLYPVGDGSSKDISSKAFVRFYVLETVARVPYFAYLSVLHLRETFGERAFSNAQENRLRTHYAEADNELHHLLIMESLGGNSNLLDRALAQSMAFVYYWYVVLIYSLVSSQAAYHLSELIEDHAYDTYDEFLKLYETELRTLPVPEIAKQYYMYDYPSFFPLFCTTGANRPGSKSSPPLIQLNSLYDVFVCIRNDEKEHWKTLCNLVQYDHMSADHHFASPIESTKPAAVTQ
jgi:ubiquinol oxidase